ncbi:hypothetical protein J3459_013745 [Metarhizium acridum]|uniref:Subtilisin-like protease n=1 Tax=Metarhizium acridum (strain CQMa 102) TaxID=655827 RepID=E9DTC7_METAQ|nr:uncharacterized protein MAC_00765 [Metarhizium acridum CQMa 102]EFY92982.1 hypothetical protein MAC_00765 [Metarhizium acridum CQMa 102]KAG8412851.1 hypothetical protein J3458_013284 [Metarhizium acridum]KAG8416121.1 hypothetical protein J3459_013745 [Metarhizium acridum]
MKAYPFIGKALCLAFYARPSLALKVPYQDELTMGQGYNTFLGRGLIHDAVMTTSEKDAAANSINNRSERPGNKNSTGRFNFTEPGPVMPGVDLDGYFTPTSPEELARIIDEANKASSDKEKRNGATNMISDKKMSVKGCQAEVHSHIEFVSDYTSYLKALGVNAATSFEMGGKLMARIMLTFDEASDKEDIKATAEASLGFWGVSGQLSTEVAKNMEKLSKQAQVKVKIFYQGDIGRQLQGRSEPSDEQNSAQQIFASAKSWADTFLEMACDQDYSYQTLLDTYTNIGNFPQNQSIVHYTTAGAVAYQLLGEMVKHTELRKTLQMREALSQEEDREIQLHETRLINAQKNWIRETARNPDNALETVQALFALSNEYYKKWKPYLTAQSSPVEIKAFDRLVSAKDPDTKNPATYDCSHWHEWYGQDQWTWSKVRFCLPTQTDVFKLTVFREKSQYLWGSAWYYEKELYPADVTVRVTLKRVHPKPRVWTFYSEKTSRMSFTVAQKEKLLPGRYNVQVNFYQQGPYWDGTPLGEVAEFEITAS